METANGSPTSRVERDDELRIAIEKLCDEVHDLLERPDGKGQLYGSHETQRVVLEIPRAYALLAAFLAAVDEDTKYPLQYWHHIRAGDGDRQARKYFNRARNAYLERNLVQSLAFDLHLLSIGGLELRGRRGLQV